MTFIHLLLILLLEARLIIQVGWRVDQLDILEPLRWYDTTLRFDLKDLTFQDGLLDSFLLTRFAWVSPWFKVDLMVTR